MLTLVHPVLITIGAILIPSYGALAAVGVLAGLFLSQRTARRAGVDAGELWNLSIAALLAALVSQRLLLVILNWTVLRLHPAWLLTLAMVHHPLLAAAGTGTGAAVAFFFARWRQMPLRSTADALAAPLALGSAFEQVGALLAGSGYGSESGARWAVTYSDVRAALWSGTPLGVALHPVQGYAALSFLAIAIFLLLWLPRRRQPGDVAGIGLMAAGVAIFFIEFWREAEGRGRFLGGAMDGPQLAAIVLVLVGALLLREPPPAVRQPPSPPAVRQPPSPPAVGQSPSALRTGDLIDSPTTGERRNDEATNE